MFDDMPDHIKRRHVPAIGKLDDAVLPPVRAIEAEIIAPAKVVRETVLDNSALLDDLTNKALQRLDEVLSEPMTGDPKSDAVIMDGIRLVMTTQLRVDDSRLKKRTTDTLAKLLERMDAEDGKLRLVNA